VLDGDAAALDEEIERLRTEGQEGIGLTRALLRRLTLLARLRAEVEQGKSPAAVMASMGKSLFWKDEKPIAAQLGRWTAPLLAKAVSRLIETERQVMSSGGPGIAAADAELFAIGRQAARLR
jgi:DNA polymerase III subunit delta